MKILHKWFQTLMGHLADTQLMTNLSYFCVNNLKLTKRPPDTWLCCCAPTSSVQLQHYQSPSLALCMNDIKPWHLSDSWWVTHSSHFWFNILKSARSPIDCHINQMISNNGTRPDTSGIDNGVIITSNLFLQIYVSHFCIPISSKRPHQARCG